MDQELKNWLDINVNTVVVCTENTRKDIKEGVVCLERLEHMVDPCNDPIFNVRILYLRNLCLYTPVTFQIPSGVCKSEHALILASMHLFEQAISVLSLNLTCDVIGVEAKTRTGAIINRAVLVCKNTQNSELFEFVSNGFTFDDFKVEKLTHDELLLLYIKLKEIIKNEDNESLRKFKANAYLERALFDLNEHTIQTRVAFMLIDSEINGNVDQLEKIKTLIVPLDSCFFNSPIVFKAEILVQLGLAYKARLFYKEAYECLLPYPLYLEKIDCLIAMRKSEEASDAIKKMIDKIGDSKERGDRMTLCNLYIKLAHLHDAPTMFDRAGECFPSAKPYYLKGLYYFKKKQYEQSVRAFEEALIYSPSCEKIRFSYACGLIEVERLTDAHHILSILKLEDPSNENIAKNLSYCCYKLKEIEKALDALRSVALSDPNSMTQLFILSVKHKKYEDVKWALSNISSIEMLKYGIAYYKDTKELDLETIKGLVQRNRYVDKETYHRLFD